MEIDFIFDPLISGRGAENLVPLQTGGKINNLQIGFPRSYHVFI